MNRHDILRNRSPGWWIGFACAFLLLSLITGTAIAVGPTEPRFGLIGMKVVCAFEAIACGVCVVLWWRSRKAWQGR